MSEEDGDAASRTMAGAALQLHGALAAEAWLSLGAAGAAGGGAGHDLLGGALGMGPQALGAAGAGSLVQGPLGTVGKQAVSLAPLQKGGMQGQLRLGGAAGGRPPLIMEL